MCLLWYISVYNDLKRASIKVDESDFGIDVALTKRYDLLTKMVEVFSKNIVAKMNNMVRRDFFETDEVKKKDVKIKM